MGEHEKTPVTSPAIYPLGSVGSRAAARAMRGSVSAMKLIWLLVEGPVPKRIEVEGACTVVRVVTCVPAAPRAELGKGLAALPAAGTGRSER
jgi:hypothetical protein